MFNLVKMDLYRLVHSLSSWIVMAFMIGAAVFSVSMTNLDIEAYQEEQPPTGLVVEDNSSDEIVAGVYVTGGEEWANGEQIELGKLISMEIQSGLTAILCVIFAALFANADQKNGYVKNIAGQFPKRGRLILSKMTAIAVWTFLMLLAFAAVTAVTGRIFWGERVCFDSLSVLVKVLGVQYLLHVGLGALILFCVTLTRSTAFSTTAGILICSGMTVFFYSAVNEIASNIRPEWNFDINRYVLESNMRMVGIETASGAMGRGALVGVAFAVLSTALAVMVIKKRDIR